jgi:hypothetical protein
MPENTNIEVVVVQIAMVYGMIVSDMKGLPD